MFFVGCGNEGGGTSVPSVPSGDGQGEWENIPIVVEKTISNPNLHKPTHILKFRNDYVSTELEKGRLAIFDDLDLKNMHYFDPRDIDESLGAPHFLAISPNGYLLISNGWGKSIVEIEDLDGSGWKEFRGMPDSEFNAPHGICVDENGWIYVGDSLNSRLVRFKDMQGSSWQVFRDIDRKVAYSRQLVCKDGAVWISNSYENRDGMNPGKGGNVLRIDNFSSGKVQIVYEEENANITGILPLDDTLLVARWGNKNDIVAVDYVNGKEYIVKNSHNELGVPYGFFEDKDSKQIINAYFGSFEANLGGLAIMKR